MRHLRPRRFLLFLSTTALVLSLLVCILWIISLFRTDTVGWAGFDDRAAQTWRNWGVSSFGGELVVYRLQTATTRLDDDPMFLTGVGVPDMKPHAFHHAWPRRNPPAERLLYIDRPAMLRSPKFPGWRARAVGVPHAFAALVLAGLGIPAVWIWLARYLAKRRPGPGCCKHCGYDLRASPERCPECGSAVAGAPGRSVSVIKHVAEQIE